MCIRAWAIFDTELCSTSVLYLELSFPCLRAAVLCIGLICIAGVGNTATIQRATS